MFLDTLGNLPNNEPAQLDAIISPTSDLCQECSATIEESCIRLSKPTVTERRWHTNCLKCSQCRRNLVAEHSMWSESKKKVICESCARNRSTQREYSGLESGFEKVTLLMQFIFLLRVALARLRSILQDSNVLPHTSGTSYCFRSLDR